MARTSITAFIVMVTAILLAHGGAVAQQGQASRTGDGLAVELVNEEIPRPQFPVLAGPEGGFMETGPARRLPDWKQAEATSPLSRLRLRALMEGGAVRINVFAVFDDSLPIDSPGPKYGAREQPIASYLVREGETVTVQELQDFGVEPSILRVVRATPRPVEQPAVAGIWYAFSKLKAVELVGFWPDPSEPTSCRLSLRNISAKDVVALEIYQSEDGRRSGHQLEIRAGSARPLIAAGGMYETEVDRSVRSDTMEDPPQRLSFVVGTVVFADGTYEGEAEVAARMEARQVGRRLQLGRVVPLLQALLDAPNQDVRSAIDGLRSSISTLRIDVDVSIVKELLVRFPALSGEKKRDLTVLVMDALKAGREEALHAIKECERTAARNSESGDFRACLSKSWARYREMTSNH